MSRTALSKKIIIISGVALAAIGLGGAYAYQNQQETPSPASPVAEVTEIKPSVVVQADKVSYRGEAGKNALELLKKHVSVETKTSSLGEYVVSINGNDGGGTKYWLFYVNDKQASVGADAYVSQAGDSIEWRLE